MINTVYKGVKGVEVYWVHWNPKSVTKMRTYVHSYIHEMTVVIPMKHND